MVSKPFDSDFARGPYGASIRRAPEASPERKRAQIARYRAPCMITLVDRQDVQIGGYLKSVC